MGGTVPLGYVVRDRKLVIDEAEAETVRHIFRRYLALGSGQLLIGELRRDGYRTKLRRQTDKPARGGVPFERGSLFYLLANRIYLGELVHKGKYHPGEHAPIIDQPLWDAVQALVAENRDKATRPDQRTEPSLLTGLIVDGEGRRMTPTHTVKGARRYRYYVTHSSELTQSSPPAWRVPAHDAETIVCDRLKQLLSDRGAIRRLVEPVDASAAALQLALTSASMLRAQVEGRRELITSLIEDVQLGDAQLAITVPAQPLLRLLRLTTDQLDGHQSPELVLTAAAFRRRVGKEVRLLVPAAADAAHSRDVKALTAFAEALAARETLLANPDRTIEQMAGEMGVCRIRLGRLLRMSFATPEAVESAMEAEQPGMM